MLFKPRTRQQDVLKYTEGRMGVVAVPGSGKTITLSALAAKLVAEMPFEEGQEVLVVTLVNSAVGNFARQVGKFIGQRELLPGLGYRVRTLHGLATDIVRERPALAGLEDRFTIVDERESGDILQEAALSWLRFHPNSHLPYVAEEQLDTPRVLRQDWPEAVQDMAAAFIKNAKDVKLTPEAVRELLTAYGQPLPLAEMCLEIYESYERGLRYRGAVDFQDLIRLALQVLYLDPQYLERLQTRWPYILEDEAQDSSQLQEEILRKLVGKNGNWVRVGDPNQAIYETFTTASPEHLRGFVQEEGVKKRELPNSGRSMRSIVRLANHLIAWTREHPNEAIRSIKPLDKPFIEPAPKDDPQPNPPDNPEAIHLWPEKYTSEAERAAIIRSLQAWLPKNPTLTAAVLLPINASGSKLVDGLRNAGVDYVENLRTTTSTRKVVGAMSLILHYLSDPADGSALAKVYRVWMRDEAKEGDAKREVDQIARQLSGIKTVEDFIAPHQRDWLEENVSPEIGLYEHLKEFREVIRRWQAASILPIDQLVLTISGELFTREAEIATAYSLALYLRRFADTRPDARLPEFVDEMTAIAQNRRDFSGINDEDDAFDPEKHRGRVAVTTMHKAKGLEWDRVYLMSVNNFDFPSAEVYDKFIGEKWFARDQLNLQAEAVGQLKAAIAGPEAVEYSEGQATQKARLDYAAERLRLLYVGITRARRELVITWNTGKNGDQVEATALAALRGWWEAEQQQEPES